MQTEPIITFREIMRSTALEAQIMKRIRKLETFYPRLTGCLVLVELLQRHHEAGNRYHVRIDLRVPGEEIVVTHKGNLHATATHVHATKFTKQTESDRERRHIGVAIREAFEAARRRLQDYARRQRGAMKTAAGPARGRIAELFPIDEYGYIQADDGHEVYFQKSSVLKGAFKGLAVGRTVSFVEEQGDRGPQASTVRLLHPRRVGRTSQVESVFASEGRRP